MYRVWEWRFWNGHKLEHSRKLIFRSHWKLLVVWFLSFSVTFLWDAVHPRHHTSAKRNQSLMVKFTSVRQNKMNEFITLAVTNHVSVISVVLMGNFCYGIHYVFLSAKEIELFILQPFCSRVHWCPAHTKLFLLNKAWTSSFMVASQFTGTVRTNRAHRWQVNRVNASSKDCPIYLYDA